MFAKNFAIIKKVCGKPLLVFSRPVRFGEKLLNPQVVVTEITKSIYKIFVLNRIFRQKSKFW